MDNATQADLNIIKQSIFKELGSIEAIYLFGSVAKGTQDESSDYDILVFVNKSPPQKIKAIARIRNDASDRITRPFDLIILNVNDLQIPSPFLYEVYHNHLIIYGKDVIEKCKEIIKNIRPIVKNGVKIGYYV